MSKITQTNKTVSITKQNKTPVWVWFLALVPVLSSGLFLLILADAIPFIELEIFYDTLDGGVAWHTSGILVLVLAMAVWGVCGFAYGYFRAKMLPAVLTSHAFPFVCTVIYTFCVIAAYFCADAAETAASFSDAALWASLGMGLFSYIDTFIHGIISLGNFGLYVDLIFMVLTFIVGYAIGKSRRLKA